MASTGEIYLHIFLIIVVSIEELSYKYCWQGFRNIVIKIIIMKNISKKAIGMALCMGILLFSITGCYEGHYYHRYHHHTRGWYDHHHMPPPAGIDFNVDVDAR
jgi:hypothetical protein